MSGRLIPFPGMRRLADLPATAPKADPLVFGRCYLDLETDPAIVFVCIQRGEEPAASDYWIPSDRCNTAAEALDWLEHVGRKTWSTPELLGDLARALIAVMAEAERRRAASPPPRRRRRRT